MICSELLYILVMKNLSKWVPLKSGPHSLLKIILSDEEELVQMCIRDVISWIPLILLRIYDNRIKLKCILKESNKETGYLASGINEDDPFC